MDDLVLPAKVLDYGPRSEGSGVGSVVEEVHREAVGDELLESGYTPSLTLSRIRARHMG